MTLLAAYNYAPGPVVKDWSGNGRDFTLTGSSTRTTPGGGYTYGGAQPTTRGLTQTTPEVQLGAPGLWFNTLARTVMSWVIAGPGDPSWFLEHHRNAEDTGVFGWLFLSATLRGRAKNAANVAFEVNSPTDAPNHHHLALTHDGTTLRHYRDGVLLGSSAMASAVWDADVLRIFTNSGPGVVLSETRFFDEALDAAAITTWMATPVGDTIALGTASEIDAAHPMAWSKQPGLGTATETDAAHPMTWAKTLALGTATEAGTAHPMTWRKRPVFGRATETDTAHPMSWATSVGYDPMEDPEAVILPNPANAILRPNPADATLQTNLAEATL